MRVALLLLAAAAAAAHDDPPAASLAVAAGQTATLANGYVSAVFDLRTPSVASLGADFSGGAAYVNVLSAPLKLEQEDLTGAICSAAAASAS